MIKSSKTNIKSKKQKLGLYRWLSPDEIQERDNKIKTFNTSKEKAYDVIQKLLNR